MYFILFKNHDNVKYVLGEILKNTHMIQQYESFWNALTETYVSQIIIKRLCKKYI